MKVFKLSFVSVAILFLIACKGNSTMKLASGTDGALAAPGASSVSANITAENGGVIQLQNMRLTIPVGALEKDTEISAAITNVHASAYDGAITMGTGVKFQPEGLQFLKPVEVEFCYAGTEVHTKKLNEKSAMVYYAEDDGQLVGMSGVVDEARHCVTGHIEHFSVYIPAAQSEAIGNTAPNITGANFLPASTTIMAGVPVRVRTAINDFNGGGVRGTVVSAFFMYCRTGDATCNLNPATATNKVPLLPDTTDGSVTNRYYVTIPESFVTLAGFQYRFQAYDNVGGVRLTPIVTRAVTRTAVALRLNPPAVINISAGFVRDFTLQANDGTAWRNISADTFGVTGGIGTIARTGPSTLRLNATTKGVGSANAAAGALNTSVLIQVQTGLLTHIELMDDNQVVITNPINLGAGSTYRFDALGYDAYGNTAFINPSFSVSGGVGTIDATALFTASAAAPLSGTVTATIGGVSDTTTINVHTQPTVTSTNPADGAMGVNINTPVAITFSEPMLTSSLTTTTTNACVGSVNISSDNFGTCVPMTSTTPVFSAGDSVLTIQPAASLPYGATYKVRISNTANSVNGVSLTGVYETATGFGVLAPPPGSLDFSFNSAVEATGAVYALTIDGGGKILIGGQFASYAGTLRHGIARLNSDGTLDDTFNSASGVNGGVYALTVDGSGKILIGGLFTSYAGMPQQSVARLN